MRESTDGERAWSKEELKEVVISIVVVLLIPLLFIKGLGLILGTPTPLVSVISHSMDPTFTRGDMLILKGVDPKEIEIGDIVVYDRPGSKYPIVHRVIERKEYAGKVYIITKGDNNYYPDTGWVRIPGSNPEYWIPAEAVRGKVIAIVPKLGYPSILFREKIVRSVKEALGYG